MFVGLCRKLLKLLCVYYAVMRTQFAWRPDVSGDFVEVKLLDRGPSRMVMKTLPALWRDSKETSAQVAEVIEISSQSPTQRRTSPSAESPMRKEQQSLAHLLFETLDDLKRTAGSCLRAHDRNDLIQQLDAAVLEVLDANQSQQPLQSIREVVETARCHLGQ